MPIDPRRPIARGVKQPLRCLGGGQLTRLHTLNRGFNAMPVVLMLVVEGQVNTCVWDAWDSPRIVQVVHTFAILLNRSIYRIREGKISR